MGTVYVKTHILNGDSLSKPISFVGTVMSKPIPFMGTVM